MDVQSLQTHLESGLSHQRTAFIPCSVATEGMQTGNTTRDQIIFDTISQKMNYKQEELRNKLKVKYNYQDKEKGLKTLAVKWHANRMEKIITGQSRNVEQKGFRTSKTPKVQEMQEVSTGLFNTTAYTANNVTHQTTMNENTETFETDFSISPSQHNRQVGKIRLKPLQTTGRISKNIKQTAHTPKPSIKHVNYFDESTFMELQKDKVNLLKPLKVVTQNKVRQILETSDNKKKFVESMLLTSPGLDSNMRLKGDETPEFETMTNDHISKIMLNHNSIKGDEFMPYTPQAFRSNLRSLNVVVSRETPIDSKSQFIYEPESPQRSIFKKISQRVSGNIIDDAPKLKEKFQFAAQQQAERSPEIEKRDFMHSTYLTKLFCHNKDISLSQHRHAQMKYNLNQIKSNTLITLIGKNETPRSLNSSKNRNTKNFTIDHFYDFLRSQGESDKAQHLKEQAEIEQLRLQANNSQEFAQKMREMQMSKEERSKMLKDLYVDLQAMYDERMVIQAEIDSRQDRYLSRHREFQQKNRGKKPSEMRDFADKQGDALLSIIDREVLFARDNSQNLVKNMENLIRFAKDQEDFSFVKYLEKMQNEPMIYEIFKSEVEPNHCSFQAALNEEEHFLAPKKKLKTLVKKAIKKLPKNKYDILTVISQYKLQQIFESGLFTSFENDSQNLHQIGEIYQKANQNLFETNVDVSEQKVAKIEQKFRANEMKLQQMLNRGLEESPNQMVRSSSGQMSGVVTTQQSPMGSGVFRGIQSSFGFAIQEYSKVNNKNECIEEALAPQIKQNTYYEIAKNGKSKESLENDDIEDLNITHFNTINKDHDISFPTFVKIQNGILFLRERYFTPSQISALSYHMCNSQNYVQKLTLDNCKLTDDFFSKILEAVQTQQSLKELTYIQNEIGDKSVEKIKEILKSGSGVFVRSLSLSKNKIQTKYMIEIIEAILNSNSIIKVKISNEDLNDSEIIDKICECLERTQILSHLDLSWSNISGHNLALISQTLSLFPNKLRFLNLSYNQINSEFCDYFLDFIKKTQSLNHLNLSGMKLPQEFILNISDEMAQVSSSLMAVHLSDNDIMGEEALEVLEVYQVQESHLHQRIDEEHIVSGQIMKEFRKQNAKEGLVEYKDHLTKSHVKKNISVNSKVQSQESTLGSFVLTRKLNMPELVFNQNLSSNSLIDTYASIKWQLQPINKGCFMCEKHKYVVIYFDSRDYSMFREMINPELKSFIKSQLNLSPKDKEMSIIGSVTHSWSRKLQMIDANVFSLLSVTQKKEIFTDLKQGKHIREEVVNLIQMAKLQKVQNLSEHLQGWDSILRDKYIENDAAVPTHLVNIPDDFGTKSYREIMSEKGEGRQVIYAEFLPAGHHEFMIYEPSKDSFWMHDFFLEQTEVDIIPQVAPEAEKLYPNVWKPWHYWDQAEVFKTDINRMAKQNQLYFQPERVIKDPQDLVETKQLLIKNYNVILIIFRQIQSESSLYPECDFESCWNFFKTIQQDIKFSISDSENENGEMSDGAVSTGDEKFSRNQFELTFIRSKRFDKEKGIKGSLCRAEFLDLIVRMIHVRYPRDQKHSSNVQDFIRDYFTDSYNKSSILINRAGFRQNKTLNALFYDNRRFLESVFKRLKKQDGMTIQPIEAIFLKKFDEQYKLKMADYKADPEGKEQPLEGKKMLKKLFVYSKMEIVDEMRQEYKYFHLHFVEFLELICRIAQHLSEDNTKIQYLVHQVLVDLFEAEQILKKKANKHYDPEKDDPIVGPNQDIEAEQTKNEEIAQMIMKQ